MAKELHVTICERQPYIRGLYTAALSGEFFTDGAISMSAVDWIRELASVLGASISVSPAIKGAPGEWLVKDYIPSQVRRMIQLPTSRSQAVLCVDGRLADVAFVNQYGKMMEVIRIPGPDPDFLPNGGDHVVIQHGHSDPAEYGIEGEKSWEGCGWRTAKVMSLKVAGWDYSIVHTPDGNITALRDNSNNNSNE